MTTKMSLAQTDQQAKVFVATFRKLGYPNVAVIGPDTSLEVFGVLQPAKWIVLASTERIAASNQAAGAISQEAKEISDQPASEETPTETPAPSPTPTPPGGNS